MKLKTLVEKYIEYRCAMGEKFRTNARILRSFYRGLGEDSLVVSLPDKKVLGFLYSTEQITTGWFVKHTALRGFYNYAMCRGYMKHCPLPKELPRRPLGLTPYIYSKGELRSLFDASLIYQKNKSLVEPFAIQVIFKLLYATGLRLSEALALDIDDININEMVITIRETKFYKQRYIPFNQQVATLLINYRKWRSKIIAENNAMFVSKKGLPLNTDTVRGCFQRIRQKAAIHRTNKLGPPPRIHDLRHTFAVHRLVNWYREGKDVQKLLPILSTYMGHTYLAATSVYLTMTDDLLCEAGSRFQHYAQGE